MGKRYWWLKLPENFFDAIEIKKLRRIAGGDTYTIIYLKMMLLSLKNNGYITYDCEEEEFVSDLALDINEDEANVSVAVAFLEKHGMLSRTDEESSVVLPQVEGLIGSETAGAMRVREHRARKKALHCNASETAVKQIGNVEIDIEKELEKEKELEIDKELQQPPVVPRADTADCSKVIQFWDKNIAPITAYHADQLQSLVDEVGVAAVEAGMKAALDNNVRKLNYVIAAARGIAYEGNNSKPNARKAASKNDVQGTYEKLMQKYAGGAFDND